MPARPSPVTVTDELLVHVLDALGEIRDRLPERSPEPADGSTKVSEPAAPASKRTASRGSVSKQTKIKE